MSNIHRKAPGSSTLELRAQAGAELAAWGWMSVGEVVKLWVLIFLVLSVLSTKVVVNTEIGGGIVKKGAERLSTRQANEFVSYHTSLYNIPFMAKYVSFWVSHMG